jgi:glycyl-tRNA synthetase beta chain
MDLPELTGIDREISLSALLAKAATLVGPTSRSDAFEWSGDVRQNAEAFALERVRYALEQRRLPVEVVRAATASSDVRPLRARRVAEALQSMRASEDFQALAVLFKRVKNIAKELRDRTDLDRTALAEPAEQALLAELDARRPRVRQAADVHDYRRAFTEISPLRSPVDRFFTDVFVMVDDPRLRTARLTLMAELRDLILDLADISEIVPQTE